MVVKWNVSNEIRTVNVTGCKFPSPILLMDLSGGKKKTKTKTVLSYNVFYI